MCVADRRVDETSSAFGSASFVFPPKFVFSETRGTPSPSNREEDLVSVVSRSFFSRSRSASRASASAAAVNALTAAAETGMAFCAKSPTASVMVCACVGTPPEENANRFFFGRSEHADAGCEARPT